MTNSSGLRISRLARSYVKLNVGSNWKILIKEREVSVVFSLFALGYTSPVFSEPNKPLKKVNQVLAMAS